MESAPFFRILVLVVVLTIVGGFSVRYIVLHPRSVLMGACMTVEPRGAWCGSGCLAGEKPARKKEPHEHLCSRIIAFRFAALLWPAHGKISLESALHCLPQERHGSRGLGKGPFANVTEQ